MSSKKKNARAAALDILEAVEKNQAYSNLLLNQVIERYNIEGPDASLLTELTYGTIQRKMTLDYYLEPFIKKKTEGWVRNLLRLSLYQMLYLDKIPDRAIIYEAVELAKDRGHKGIAGMVNGVLRAIQRNGVPKLDAISDPLERLSIETSHPLWLVKRWSVQFGYEKTAAMCRENILPATQTARVNMTRSTPEEAAARLREDGFEVQMSQVLPEALRAVRGNLARSSAYREGLITIQDESSMAVAYALDLEKGHRVLDACAAPGGKTTHIAEKLSGGGMVTALDLHAHKVKLIEDNAARLGLGNIETKTMDSRRSSEAFEHGSFDRVLVDAPCSGLGVLRRKPDIKYAKKESDLNSLQDVQLSILDSAAKLVKPGGKLVYSTCTVDREENTGTAGHFLENHPEFERCDLSLPEAMHTFVNEQTLQVFPQDFGGDGFFISCFRKKVN